MFTIVTDSTSDIPEELAVKHKIHVIPQNIIWGKENVLDGVEMDSATFYQRLATDSTIPHTAAPAPGDFARAYEASLEAFPVNEVLCLTLSQKLSVTYTSAVQGTELVPFQVTVLDTETASLGLGILVLLAAALRESGANVDDTVAELKRHIPNIRVYFVVSTLDYLHRGGRIGRAKHLMGSALNIKPILSLDGGEIRPKESVRTHNKALNRLLEIVYTEGANRTITRMGVMHGQAEKEAQFLLERLRERFNPVHLYESHVCAAVGVHCGPGVVGISYDLTEN
ncbi:MAG: DegV family protein [Anaerolineae bacterium]|jgi:DegV family protein with EDD domain|nr:DegV family protein [Anaerolineae bacterium]